MSKRESRNILIVTFIAAAIAVFGSIAYSNYDFKGTGMSGQTNTNWKMDITNISVCSLNDQAKDSRCQAIAGSAEDVSNETYISEANSLRAIFTANLYEYQDAITYKVVVENSGNFDAKLTSVRFDEVEDSPVIFTYNNLVEGEVIEAHSSKTFYVMVSYIDDEEIDTNKFVNAVTLNFVVNN